ncbi:LuxR C-terminal-related transcriptional regulator [Baekduia sp. Peel2402]|uniref:LuxR C-terminal-related transcriptional regulator n=1 Tax=Baekduia sp. Peel2402 TaxID=3458296 RepID=UPI00403EF13B
MLTSTSPEWPIGREALRARLDAAADAGGVVLLAAEPGTGKTVLLRQWLAGRVVAADTAEPLSLTDPADAVARLRDGSVALLVVDAAETLDADARVALGDALAHRAAGVAAVIASRADLGLCALELGRTAPVLLLDADDLALGTAEVRAALEAWGWDGVTAGEAHAVAFEADGWCAGVRLAAAAGRGGLRGSHARDVLGAVAGDAVLDELVALSALDELVALSALDELDARGIAEVLGLDSDAAAARLRWLIAARVFLRRGADEGTWRFARPVLRALRQELAARPAPAVTGNGAGDPPDMGAALLEDDVLAGRAIELLLAGRLAAPTPRAIGLAPPPSRAGRAAAALALLEIGDAETARALVAPADLGTDAVGLAVAVAAARAAGDRDAIEAAVDRITARARASADEDAEAHGLEAYALLQLARLEIVEGRVAEADEHLRLAAGLAERSRACAIFSRARVGRAELAVTAGRLGEAERLVASVPEDTPRAATRARRALVLAEVAYARDDRAVAHARLEQARAAARATRSPELWFHVHFLDALLLDAEGDDDRATERLAEAVAMRERCAAPPPDARTIEVLRVRLLARAGRVEEAGALLARLERERDPFAAPVVDLVAARAALARGAPDEASRRLHPWAVTAPVPGLDVWHLSTFAVATDRLGDREAAHAALERALDRAAPEGVMRPFLEDGVRLRELLGRHLDRGTAHAGFVLQLGEHLATGRPAPEGEILNPLTDRERTVLGRLPTELSAAEIADALHVSEATVRTHMHNIYEKLGVSSRRDAVSRARDLRLLTAQQR